MYPKASLRLHLPDPAAYIRSRSTVQLEKTSLHRSPVRGMASPSPPQIAILG